MLLCVSAAPLLSQSAAELKERRQELLEEIRQSNRRLTTTRKDKETTLEQLTLLQRQIRNREELITTLQSEIEFTDASINRTHEVIDALSEDVTRLQVEYADLLRAAYRAHLRNSWITFLLSSSSFNEAFRRWQYLRQYQRFRGRQAKLITATQTMLKSKLSQLESRRTEKEDLLGSVQNQQVALNRERNAQDQLLTRLKSSEAELLAKIKKQEEAREELSAAIEGAITAEVDRIRRAERSNTPPPASTTTTAAPAAASRPAAPSTKVSAGNFGSQRGRLPWPVDGGDIIRRFGRQPHPTVPNVEISNNGVDISVDGRETVSVVADGVVVSTHFVPGYRNMVLVRHGDYYTVYSNLETLRVKGGDELSTGDPIGETSASAGEFHFEVWRQKERLNPENWIRSR